LSEADFEFYRRIVIEKQISDFKESEKFGFHLSRLPGNIIVFNSFAYSNENSSPFFSIDFDI